MEKYYRFAGVEIAVSIPAERMYDDDRGLAPFRVPEVVEPHRFSFEIVEQFSPPGGEQMAEFPGYRVYRQGEGNVRYIGSVAQGWQNGYIRAEHQGKKHAVQLKASQFQGKIGVKTVLNALEAEHLVVQAGGFILHSSFIEWKGKAILFTAPSETGKSTQADLWRSLRGAQIINGDRAAVQIVNAEVQAAGIPFAGSSQYCENRTLPLAAIVYLKQAPATTICTLQGMEAFRRVWEGVSVNTWNREDVNLALSAVQQVIGQVPVFELACTPDESAVNALEQSLRE